MAFPLGLAPPPCRSPGVGRSLCVPMCPPTCAPGATSLTLLDVFRMGTSFSALILASRSSHARPVFWKRILFPGVGAGAAEAGDDRTRAWHPPDHSTGHGTLTSPLLCPGQWRPRAGPGPAGTGEGWEGLGGRGSRGGEGCGPGALAVPGSWPGCRSRGHVALEDASPTGPRLTCTCVHLTGPGPHFPSGLPHWWGLGASSLHLLGKVLRVLTDGMGQLGHGVQHQVIEDHL